MRFDHHGNHISGRNNGMLDSALMDSLRAESMKTARRIVSQITISVKEEFRKEEVLLLFDGSYAAKKTYASPLFSDVDVTCVAPLRSVSETGLNMPYLERLTLSFKQAVAELKDQGIYVVVSHEFRMESMVQSVARATLPCKKESLRAK